MKQLPLRWGAATLPFLVTLGCGAAYEGAVREDLREVGAQLATPGEPATVELDGTLPSYVRYASAQSPELRASYERWRAATHRIEPARRMPDPMVTYAFYALPVQTRVGPQRHRLGIRQTIPWPTRLTAAADARSLMARSAQRGFEARMLALRERVARAWWRLWTIERRRRVLAEQLTLVEALTEAARARLEVGRASLAQVAQLDLMHARIDDSLRGLDETESAAQAALRAAIGAPAGTPTPIADEIHGHALPAEGHDALAESVREHPGLEAFEQRAQSHEAAAGAAEATRLPSFVLGVDWIETGESAMPTNGSGDDALLLSIGVSVPIFGQEAGAEQQRAEEAEAAAERADRAAAEDAALARLAEALADVRDSYRRLALYEDTLVPQARAAYESMAGAYATGEEGVAAMIVAERELLEIEMQWIAARAEHGAAWARLEAVVGRPVRAEGAR